MATHFKGPVLSANGFTGTGASSTTGNMTAAAYVSGAATFSLAAVLQGTVAINPAEIAAAESAETAITVTGAAAGDIIIMNIPALLETGLAFSGARVSAANTAQVRLTNVTAAPVNGASLTWSYLVLRPTAL